MDNTVRLNKYISNSGYTSRRKADDLIFSGRVKVNNSVEKNPGFRVNPNSDTVVVEGKKISSGEKLVYIILNKPEEIISSVEDQFDRKTVIDLVDIKERIYPVGRLDYDSKGLIILTNDGDLTYKLTHPKHEVFKKYYVKVNKFITNKDIELLTSGVVIEGYKTNKSHIDIIKRKGRETDLYIMIDEGRNRQIRKMFEEVAAEVKVLKRVSIGDLNLGNLKEGNWRYLTKKEVEYLKSL